MTDSDARTQQKAFEHTGDSNILGLFGAAVLLAPFVVVGIAVGALVRWLRR